MKLCLQKERLFFSPYFKKDHKFLPIMCHLKEMNSIGYIDQSYLTDINIYKTNLVKQKTLIPRIKLKILLKIINHIQ